jgi:hypothetical protein
MRLIYSLRLSLEPSRPGSSLELIAPVDGEGASRHCRPLNRKKRLVDLGPGDHVLHRGRVYKIQDVEPYRWHVLTDDVLRKRQHPADGYVAASDPS